ncbi:unnamed protein product, partial [Rotaria sp. Silwood2]
IALQVAQAVDYKYCWKKLAFHYLITRNYETQQKTGENWTSRLYYDTATYGIDEQSKLSKESLVEKVIIFKCKRVFYLFL